MFRLRFDGDEGSSLMSPNFSVESSFRLRRRRKNQASAPMSATPRMEATTAAAIKPPDMPELFCDTPSDALAPVEGVLTTVCVTIAPPPWVTVRTLVVGGRVDSVSDCED